MLMFVCLFVRPSGSSLSSRSLERFYLYCLKTTSRVAHFSVTDREQPGCSAEAELRQQETLTWSEFRVAMASPLSVSYQSDRDICGGK